jgi:hypothetical protein
LRVDFFRVTAEIEGLEAEGAHKASARRPLLASPGALPGLSDDQRHRPARARSSPRRSIPMLSCRSCRPNAPFAELVRLSSTSVADEMRMEHTRRVLGE